MPCWLYFKFRSEVWWVAVSGSGSTKYCQQSQLAKRLPVAAFIPFFGWQGGYLQPLSSRSFSDRATHGHFHPVPWVTGLPTATLIPFLGWQGYLQPLSSHSLGDRATHGRFHPVPWMTGLPVAAFVPFLGRQGYPWPLSSVPRVTWAQTGHLNSWWFILISSTCWTNTFWDNVRLSSFKATFYLEWVLRRT